jgi:hypothetical protein
MGIRFFCPNGHKLNVKDHLAGKRGVCPKCGAKFAIPMPADLQAGDVAQPVGVGQSQSIEIAVSPATNQPGTNPVAAPSAIIPVTEPDLAPPTDAPSSTPGPAAAPADALPTSILGGPPPVQPAAADASPDAPYPLRRGSGRRNQVLVSLLLLAVVIVLAGVLIWVLKREGSAPPAEKEKKTAMDAASPYLSTLDFGSVTA